MKRDLLFEIGCEEIPARLVDSARRQLLDLLTEALNQAGMIDKGKGKGKGKPQFQSWGTPRRIAVYAPSLLAVQPDTTTTETGPPVSAAFDSDGKPTKAGEGFARKHDVKVGELKRIKTDKGEYVSVRVHRKGRKTEAILKDILPQVMEKIEFPRSMCWNHEAPARFIRPVRWIVAIFAGKVIRFSFGDVVSGKRTFGHRTISRRAITITQAGKYEAILKRSGVIADSAKRKEAILSGAKQAVGRGRLHLRRDDALVEKLANLCEHPAAVAGEFASEFLDLPDEVLTTVMRHHQNYLSVEDRSGKLAPNFVAVLDRRPGKAEKIRKGHESVLEARFRDAQFFWEADLKTSLEDRLGELDRMTFQSDLGSYGDKIRRMERLCTQIGEGMVFEGRRADIKMAVGRHADTNTSERQAERRHTDININITALRRAAKLCKSDLTTQIVGELPELQGMAGGLYAERQGEPSEVAQAIYGHYRPEGPHDSLPASPETIALSLTDKLDTLLGCFAVGAAPTGSRDPYSLRRAANGAVRVIVECGVRMDISKALHAAAEAACAVTQTDSDTLTAQVGEFMRDRIRHYFREVRGFRYDEVSACMGAGWHDLLDLESRLHATQEIRPTPDFEPLAASFKRIRNILEQAGERQSHLERELRADLFEDGAERELFDRFESARARVSDMRGTARYSDALRVIASLRPTVDTYFDEVMVNAPEAEVRANRLAFLAKMLEEFSTIADFAEIVIPKKD